LLRTGGAVTDRRLRAQSFTGVGIELPGNGQSFSDLITRQRSAEVAAVCTVDLTRVKTIVAQFLLHFTNVVISPNCSSHSKAHR
jgi:hypothetical protein